MYQQRYAEDILKKFSFTNIPVTTIPIRPGKSLARTPGHQCTDTYRLLYQRLVGGASNCCFFWNPDEVVVTWPFTTITVDLVGSDPRGEVKDSVTFFSWSCR